MRTLLTKPEFLVILLVMVAFGAAWAFRQAAAQPEEVTLRRIMQLEGIRFDVPIDPTGVPISASRAVAMAREQSAVVIPSHAVGKAYLVAMQPHRDAPVRPAWIVHFTNLRSRRQSVQSE